jgi:acetyltransferase
MVRDPQFGPLVMVGFGGIHVEVLRDTASRLAPFDPAEARAMIEELRMAPVLRGHRGQPPADVEALALAVSRFSRLAEDAPEIVEMELNPLVVNADGAIAVDARATVEAAWAGRPPAVIVARPDEQRGEISGTRII